MRTKEEIAMSLGYKPNESFGMQMWFKDGMNYLRLSDTPDSERIDDAYWCQFKAARYTILFFVLAVMDFAIFKLTAPEFGVSLIFAGHRHSQYGVCAGGCQSLEKSLVLMHL